MTDETKLLPCPFCGSPSYTDDGTLRIFGKRTGHSYAVACSFCEATAGGDDDKTIAIAAWNTRALAASQPADPVTDDPECTDCGGTGVTYQTERRCACQPADPVTNADCQQPEGA